MRLIVCSLLLFFGFVSCKKQEVQLPKNDISVMTEILDHSPVYLFFKVEGNDTIVDVNKNNTISSTNWVFNIDKRLPLDKVIPEIKKLQAKKEGSSHKKENRINVFSYADSLHQNLAFLPFADVQFLYDNQFSKFFIKEKTDVYKEYNNLYVNFKKDNNITVDGNDIEREELVSFLKEFSEITAEGKQTIIHLNFEKQLLFDDYIQNKLLIWQVTSDKVQISTYEFIYDITKIPDCNCKL